MLKVIDGHNVFALFLI